MNSTSPHPVSNLAVPVDDGGCDHLIGMELPAIALPSTSGEQIQLAKQPGRVVVFCYPMTGKPGVDLPDGWDEMPGARGCTPQSCSFRDHFSELRDLGVDAIFGLSVRPLEEQSEAAERLNLPYPLLSDLKLELQSAMRLPLFDLNGTTYLKRSTLIVDDGRVTKVFYPVFPPERSADEVINYLKTGR